MSELKIWKAAIYIRISKDNGEDTLESQEFIVTKHLNALGNVRICTVKIDDGYSGLHCDRPAFREMLRDIEQGRIDCVAVRDLSRFSRNYIDAGRYIQKIFPSLGVRFISVFERIDFMKAPDHNDSFMLSVRNVVNEAYLRNLSQNIKSSLQQGYREGKYLNAFSPYGYRKSQTDKYRLKPDPQAAETVHSIYQWKLDGMSAAAMAERLESLGIPSPAEHKKSFSGAYCTGFQKNDSAKWTPIAVIRILSNRVYTGRLEQGKSQKPYFKARRRVQTLRSQWVCIENAHEAIIPLHQFEAVQRLLLMDSRSSPGEKSVSPLSGFVRCKRCGRNMIQKQNCSSKKTYHYYVCNGRNVANIPCPSHRISKTDLENEVFRQIQLRMDDVLRIYKLAPSMDMSQLRSLKNQMAVKKIGALTKELKLRHRCLDGLQDEIIIQSHTLQELEAMRKHYMQECNRLEVSIKKTEANMQAPPNAEEFFGWLERYKPYFGFISVTRPLLAYLVNRITVGQDKEVLVEFIHEQEYQFLNIATAARKWNMNRV
ncbi:MAG: recombinase family protein [Peptococcaceae bacterium]|nr:recombinase family protein [Peptococcaceae bacterium]